MAQRQVHDLILKLTSRPHSLLFTLAGQLAQALYRRGGVSVLFLPLAFHLFLHRAQVGFHLLTVAPVVWDWSETETERINLFRAE
jgi:hypothetical protein